LLEFMAQTRDIERLKGLSQGELATEYCARMAGSMMQHQEAAARAARASESPARQCEFSTFADR
jgi:hypothetical protein